MLSLTNYKSAVVIKLGDFVQSCTAADSKIPLK